MVATPLGMLGRALGRTEDPSLVDDDEEGEEFRDEPGGKSEPR